MDLDCSRQGYAVRIAPFPENEAARLAALHSYELLDTDADSSFDSFVELASELCDVPVALISLIDSSRQWFKANHGLPTILETSRDFAFCAHAIAATDILEVGDTMQDARFADNPLVTGEPHFRFYAGAPLIDRHGNALGTLCTLDYRPRTLTEKQRAALRSLASALVRLIESRKGVSTELLEDIRFVTRALEHTANPMAIVKTAIGDEPTVIVFINRAFGDLFGYLAVDLVGRPPSVLFGAKTDASKIARLRVASATGEPASETLSLYTATGEPRLVELRDRAIDSVFRIISCNDLTQANAAQQVLVNTNQRLRSLIANNTDAVLTLDITGRCIDANAAASEIYGSERAALLDFGLHERTIGDLFPGGEAFPEALRSGEPLRFQGACEHVDGTQRFLEYKAIPILVADDIDGAYVIVKDVSEAIRATERLEQQAKRTHALCLIAGSHAVDESQQIVAALETVLDALEMQCGYVGAIVGEAICIKFVAGDPIVAAGTKIALRNTYVRQTLEFGGAFAIDDMASPHLRVEGVPHYRDWHGYISAPLSIDGVAYGAIGFLARKPIAFTETDREFVTLVSALVSASVQRQLQYERLDGLAYHDALTGLPNRAKIENELENAIGMGRRRDRAFALHFIDLDGFKSVNDRFGHAFGDLVLREVSSRIKETIRPNDVPGRLGGDEFVVVQSNVDDPAGSTALANRIVATLSKPYEIENETVRLSASVGIAMFPEDGHDAQTLFKHADDGLYRAKANGKQRAERGAMPARSVRLSDTDLHEVDHR